MKKTFAFFTAILLAFGLSGVLVSSNSGVQTGAALSADIALSQGLPAVLSCGTELTLGPNGEPIVRTGQYAFEGETITTTVLVLHGSGIENIEEVFQLADGDIELSCTPIANTFGSQIPESCGADFQDETLGFSPDFMGYYECVFTVEDPVTHYGEQGLTVLVEDDNDATAETEPDFWFFNPIIALSIGGDLAFEDSRPGAETYSDTILISNDAEAEVLLDMFISGTDFYDPSSSGAMCPTTNRLNLESFSYFATKGAYSTTHDPRSDAEGYVGIEYGTEFNPQTFYNNNELIQAGNFGGHYTANLLSSGEEMTTIFKLEVPQFCKGDFTAGSMYVWAEAL